MPEVEISCQGGFLEEGHCSAFISVSHSTRCVEEIEDLYRWSF